MRKLRAFKVMIANGFRSVWRNKGIGLVSIATIFAVMLLVGVLLLAVLNINGFVNSINASLDTIVIYLYDDTSGAETEEILEDLSHRDEINLLTYISRDQAIIEAKDMFSEDNFVLDGLEKNPLPASIVIELNEIDKAQELVNYLEKDDNIESIRYYQDLIIQFLMIDRMIKIGGFFAFIVIVILSIFVISNIIKVAISSRGEEIEIMKYVGASESFIKGPFIIEGLFYSLTGSVLAFGLLWYLYGKFDNLYSRPIYDYVSYNIIDFESINIDILIIFISIAIGIGSIGSLTSIRKYLKV